MKNVSTKRAITRQAYQFTVFGFGGVSLGIFLFVLATFLGRLPIAPPGSANAATIRTVTDIMQFIGVVVAVAGSVGVIRGLTFRRSNPLAEKTGAVLSKALDDEYTYITSINTFRLGYIDAVLVGPPGVLVFRILERRGTLLHEGEKWLKPGQDGTWLPAGFRASRDCIVDMRAVKNHLARHNLQTDAIFGVVVLIGDARITEKTPVIPGVTLDGLLERLRTGYMAKPRLDSAAAAAIVALLKGE